MDGRDRGLRPGLSVARLGSDGESDREERIHEGRADKHAYLREKLAEHISDAKELREGTLRDETIPGVPAANSGLPPEAGGKAARDQDDEAPWPDE